jgi:hypothetical protein
MFDDHPFDNYADFDLDGDELERSKTCNRCGATDLHWDMVRSRWILFDEIGDRHDCRLTEAEDGFERIE